MQPLTDNARTSGQRPEEFTEPVRNRLPEARSTTYAALRTARVPGTGARPGEFFGPRPAGNAAPPYDSGIPPREATTVEHAGEAPGVRPVTARGRSHRRAARTVMRGDGLHAAPALRDRQEHATGRPERAGEAGPSAAGPVPDHVLAQRPRPHPRPRAGKRPARDRFAPHGRYDEERAGAFPARRHRTDASEAR